MALDPAENLKRVSVQVTHEQAAWLEARARRLGGLSVAAVARMVIEEAINAERALQERAS